MEHGVLIVDGNAQRRGELTRQLAQWGFQSRDVDNAEAALRLLRGAGGLQTILLDQKLPGVAGISLFDHLAQHHAGLPVILLADNTDSTAATRAFRAGAFDVLTWPEEASLLQSTVGAALEHRRTTLLTLEYRRNLERVVEERTAKLRAAMTDLERLYDVTLEAMGDALDLRDAETQGHSKRVTAYTIVLARAMGLSPDELKTVARGALLHDIGKIATPDAILLKPGKLTPDEMKVMRQHCRQGYEMVRKIPFLQDAAEIVLAHQESFDGGGYPYALRGDEIPLGARIFAIADALDAMTSERPYRKAMSFRHAIQEIERCSGTQFDPVVVRVFLAMPRGTWSLIREQTGREAQANALLRAAAA